MPSNIILTSDTIFPSENSRRPCKRYLMRYISGKGRLTVAYVPSPSFSSCWKLLGCRLSIVAILRPPPRLRTEMLLSVRSATLRVPTCVGCRWMSGGSRRV